MTGRELRQSIYGMAVDYGDMGLKEKLMHHHVLIQCFENPDHTAEYIMNNLLDEATDDPEYHGFSRSDVQYFITRYREELGIEEIFEDKPWVDPAGGIHDPDEKDPAKQYE